MLRYNPQELQLLSNIVAWKTFIEPRPVLNSKTHELGQPVLIHKRVNRKNFNVMARCVKYLYQQFHIDPADFDDEYDHGSANDKEVIKDLVQLQFWTQSMPLKPLSTIPRLLRSIAVNAYHAGSIVEKELQQLHVRERNAKIARKVPFRRLTAN